MTWQQVRAEFEALVELPEPARQARLHELESTDAWLAGQLRQLLRHDSTAVGFLERTPPPASAPAVPTVALPGQRLGRFVLDKPLGAGGMGAVWEARQVDPVRRVAIKLVVRSARSQVDRWRFQHEVQVLAVLNHPAIATFYEAGSDELAGTEVAWFAMELVDGARDVLTWARERQMPLGERLALFLRLCDAVEYGHQRGVLHRDLKPSNVLVDRTGQLKLIDFGIARALSGRDAALGTRTETGAVVGTVQYMAPEQLQGRHDAIGTPADVYALGVLLYHLLCGRGPFDFDGVPLAGIASLVLEREPLPPTQARPDLPADLGWILLRALEKDPARRYPTVGALVLELERWRLHLPVQAGPPSAIYRLRKFVRRHRVAVAIGTALVFGMGVGLWGLWSGIEKANEGRRAAMRGTVLSREVARVTTALFDGIDDSEASRDMKVHELLDAAVVDERATAEPMVEWAIRQLRGTIYERLRRFPEACRELERARDLRGSLAAEPWAPAERAQLLEHNLVDDALLGRSLARSGQTERGEQLLLGAVAAAANGASDETRVKVLVTLCYHLVAENDNAELERRATELAEIARRIGSSRFLDGELWRAMALTGLGRHAEAKAAAEPVLQSCRDRFGPTHHKTAEALVTYVTALHQAGDLDAAEPLYPELIEATKRIYGATHDNTLMVLNNQADLLMQRGKGKQAIACMREILAVYEARGGPVTAEHLTALHNLGMVLNRAGQFAAAEPLLARAAQLSRTLLGPQDANGATMRFNHGACLAWLKRWSEAEPILLAEYAEIERVLPADHPNLGRLRRTIADAYKVNGQADQAAEWRSK